MLRHSKEAVSWMYCYFRSIGRFKLTGYIITTEV